VFEGIERALPRVLGLVPVDRLRAYAAPRQYPRNFIRAVLRPCENKDAFERRVFEKIGEQVRLVLFLHEVHRLLDQVDGGAGRRNGYGHRIAQNVVGELAYFRLHGGGEEKRLPFLGQHIDDFPDVAYEAHVEHPVRLVEHEHFECIVVDQALIREVEQPSGRGYEHVDAAFQRGGLGLLIHAAEDNGEPDSGISSVSSEALADLCGEFARRGEHQRAYRARLLPARTPAELLNDRQRERRRFSRACLCAPENVAPFQHVRDRLLLNRRRLGITFRSHCAQKRFDQFQILKFHI